MYLFNHNYVLSCGKTFAETTGTPLYGLKYPLWMVTLVLRWPYIGLKTFRDPVRTGQLGRPRLVVWPNVHLVQVIKQHVRRKLVSVQHHLPRLDAGVVPSFASPGTMGATGENPRAVFGRGLKDYGLRLTGINAFGLSTT